MKARSLIPLVIGLAVGFFAIKLGIDMVKQARAGEGDERMVVVSSRAIDAASLVEESMVSQKPVAASLAPSDGFSDLKTVVGRVTAMGVPAGVPITRSMLAPPGAEPGLAAMIPAGCRAISVSVNEESAVAGFLMPGSRVDVSAVSPRGGASKLILTDVEVGAVGQSLNQVGPDGKTVRMVKSVTLFLNPEQVQVLNAHAGKGRIRLAMRGHGSEGFDGSLWASLFGKPSGDRGGFDTGLHRHVVEVVRGGEVERLVFEKAGRRGRYQLVQEEQSGPKPGTPPGSSAREVAE